VVALDGARRSRSRLTSTRRIVRLYSIVPDEVPRASEGCTRESTMRIEPESSANRCDHTENRDLRGGYERRLRKSNRPQMLNGLTHR
jgi:hypothetical protein